MNRVIAIVLLLTIGVTGNSQKLAVTYYDSSWLLTIKPFAKYCRTGIIDTARHQYHGEVKDYYMNGRLQMRGTFRANIKVDTFYFYYPGGALMSKGTYQNNRRYGIWTYYYESGKVKSRVAFDGTFICALEHYDEDGTSRLINGSGKWEAEYYYDLLKEIVNVKGHYKDTLRHGTWEFYRRSLVRGLNHDQTLECVEEYDHGKFVKGKYYWKGVRDIHEPSMNIFPETTKFEKLEKWSRSQYASLEAYPYLKFLPKVDSSRFPVDRFAEFPGGIDSLTKILRENINISKVNKASHGSRRTPSIGILITEDGKLVITNDPYHGQPQIYTDDHMLYDRVMKIIKKMHGWTSATRNNKAVKNYFNLIVYVDNGQIGVQLLSNNELYSFYGSKSKP